MKRYNILFGGKAGQGPNLITNLIGGALIKRGYYVFYARDYQSLIRGGHNFNVLTFSNEPVYSNDSKLDVIICMDEETEKIHQKDLKKDGFILKGSSDNMYYAGRIFKMLGMDLKELENALKELKNFENNMQAAKKGYEEEKNTLCETISSKKKLYFGSGTENIAIGAIDSGLDFYCAYPMTPSTPLLGELAGRQIEENFIVLELDSEISVIGAAIGTAITGAKAMVGTSGGGYDLMTEFVSMAGMAEIPLVIYLAQRPGPSTGLPTYTAQGDLNLARHSGHGEFIRTVFAPGDINECQELASQAFYFSQKYKIPSIVLNDKHLAESFYTSTEVPKLIHSEKTTFLRKYNSYEHGEDGIVTEDSEVVNQNVKKRFAKQEEIKKDAKKFTRYKILGDKDSSNMIVSWGSTKGAILDAMKDFEVQFLQIIYMDPFPEEIEEIIDGKNLILIENNATGQLGSLIREKTGVLISERNKILRYDGRPFLADELRGEIKRRLR
ncbi:2-oxoacid:acceptor oxidoreductase family protein [Candidatus Pacearchaeota archaeon]|nr:2-oxoacid:acceptor oxidoreductase family protein [Candidatus Pacearchaeota archaeon]